MGAEPGQRWKAFTRTKDTSNRAMYLAADNRTLAFGAVDGTIRLWDIPTQKPVKIWGVLMTNCGRWSFRRPALRGRYNLRGRVQNLGPEVGRFATHADS